MSALLEVEGLCAGYGTGDVLHDVELRAAAGDVVAILGPNGAGKTSLLRALSGSIPQRSGRVELDGVAVVRWSAHRLVRRGLVHVPEGRANVIPALSVGEHLALAGGRNDDVERSFPVLRERTDQRAGTLSGGQQQMLAIALGLTLGPRVLLVDEPSAGLAPSVVDEVFERLAASRSSGTALIVAEQRVDVALRIADRGYVLERGRVVASGTADELRAHPALAGSYLGE